MGMVNLDLGDIGNLFTDIREAITGKKITDPDKQAEIELKLAQLQEALQNGQLEINKIEAANKNIFISGWRPFVGWTAGFAVAYYYVISRFLHSMFAIFNLNFPLPVLDIGTLYQLLVLLLGVAGLRSYEKIKGVNGRHG